MNLSLNYYKTALLAKLFLYIGLSHFCVDVVVQLTERKLSWPNER